MINTTRIVRGVELPIRDTHFASFDDVTFGTINATSDATTLWHCEAVVFAVPSQSMRANAILVNDEYAEHKLTIHAAKGLERGTAKRMSEVLIERLCDEGDVCALSGPNLAGEIQRGLPAATVIAGTDAANVARAQQLFHSGAFRVYASTDLVGVELAGSLKNVVALAAGIADGLALGDNAKAGIIARGLAEITRLGVAAGAEPTTFAGLAGVGDTVATCYSPLSRNRRAGEAIARGASVADAVAGAGGVVEGVEAAAAALVLAARHGIEMPIASALQSVLSGEAAVGEAIRRLLEREASREG